MSELHDLIIIGGGPAGLTTGIYSSRSGLDVVLLEKQMPGGQISTSQRVENFPGYSEAITGMELTDKMQEQAKKFGTKIENFNDVTSLKKKDNVLTIKAGDKEFSSYAIIICTGTESATLGIPGEAELKGRGVSYCATCDAAFFKDKRVFVIGGGDSALEESLLLVKFASELYIVHRRDKLRAAKVLQEEAFANKKIKFIWNSNLMEIKGGNKVEKAVLKNNKTGEITEMDVEGIFLYVGNIPNTKWLEGTIELDERGYIKTDVNLETSLKGVFAAGDVRKSQLKQATVAVGEGALAAKMAEKHINEIKKMIKK